MNRTAVAQPATATSFSPPAHGILQRKCTCGTHTMGGGQCTDCAKKTNGLQRKLAIGASNDPLEWEADRVADQVLAAPENPAVRRAPLHIQRFTGQPSAGADTTTPASVDRVLAGPGGPLEPPLRQDMEQRFGHDFSRVRVHADAQAARSADEVQAQAYTVGQHIVFGAGHFDPTSASGRRLLAHELSHTLQQLGTTPSVQRYVPCTRARMSLQDCPDREPDEEGKSHRAPMIVEYLTDPEAGFLVANFDIGKSSVKPGLTRHVNWPTLVSTVSAAGSEWEIEGLSDCHGAEPLNTGLRKERAVAVRAALPPAAAAHIVGTSGAALNDCVTTNDNMIAREWNRGVMVKAVRREIVFDDDEIKGKRPVPGPVDQPTADCNDQQKKEVAHAQPIAVDMVRNALFELRDHSSSKVKKLLRKYFNSDDERAFARVHDGLLNVVKGLTSDVKLECEERGSVMYNHFCPESNTSVTTAYVRSHWVALRVHLCEAAFGKPDLELAETLVHEFSHMWDATSDRRYCWKDCSTLAPDVAFDNADSYAGFAHDLYLERGNP